MELRVTALPLRGKENLPVQRSTPTLILRLVLSITLMLTALSVGMAGTVSAASNSQIRHGLSDSIGGSSSNWSVIRDRYGNYVGAKFRSRSDTRLRAPRVGRLDVAAGQIWSSPSTKRTIYVRVATYWRKGAHQHLTGTPRSSSMARSLLIKSGSVTITRIQGSESTGWIIKAHGDVTFKTIYHGRIDSAAGSFRKGHRPPALKAGEQATFWYLG
jgi:hypothetical protein